MTTDVKYEAFNGDLAELNGLEVITGRSFHEHRFTSFFADGERASFKSCRFEGISITNGQREAFFSNCVFEDCNFSGFGTNCRFDDCVFKTQEYVITTQLWSALANQSAGGVGAHFYRCKFQSIKYDAFQYALFSDSTFELCEFISRVHYSYFTECIFNSCNFRKTEFYETSLVNCKLESADFGAGTRFKHCDVKGMSVSRLDLSGLHDFGGLTIRDLKGMNITHDLALLRRNFSGYLQWIHVIAIGVFIFPYAWFTLSKLVAAASIQHQATVIESWSESQATKVPKGIIQKKVQAETDRLIENQDVRLNTIQEYPLILQLLNYVVSGGETCRFFKPNILSIALFLVVLTYNSLRGYLLWFTKKLEYEEVTTELPSDFAFSSSPAVAFAFKAMQWLLFVTVIATALNTIRFSLYSVPL